MDRNKFLFLMQWLVGYFYRREFITAIAKNIVASKLAKRCKIQISYAIGVAKPLSIHVDSYGTGLLPDDKIASIVNKVVDLRPAAIIEQLKLKRPIYRETARNGHFGRNLPNFAWEKCDIADAIKKEAGLK